MTPVVKPDYGKLLNEAYAARHELLVGGAVKAYVDGGNGERIEYTAASAARLESYIQRLEKLCNVAGNTGPATVWM